MAYYPSVVTVSPTGEVNTYGGSYTTSNGKTVTVPEGQQYTQTNDPYGGQPLNIYTGNSAEGLNALSTTLGSGFEGLFDLIQKNTDKNNAWSAAQAQKQMDFQERMQQIAMDFNSLEAAKNRDWQEMMSNTAHQREIADLKAAGLNPILSASGGNGAAVTSGATAAGAATPSGAKADPDQSGNSAIASLYSAMLSAQTQMYNANLSAKTNLAMAQMQQETQMYAAQLGANASMYGSNQAAQASMYNADMSYKNNEAQRNWNASHPGTVQQNVMWNDPGKTQLSGKGILNAFGTAVGKALLPISSALGWR